MNHNNQDQHKKYTLQDFTPLIVALSVITLFALTKYLLASPRDLAGFFTDFMGAFFIVFGFLKIIKLPDFVESYSSYDLITKRYRIYGYLYPFIELALGVCYLIRFNLKFVNAFTLIIMIFSAAGVANALSKKREIECACMGTVFKVPMTYVTLFEDLLMAIMALIMLII